MEKLRLRKILSILINKTKCIAAKGRDERRNVNVDGPLYLRFLFYKEPTSSPSTKSSLNFLMFSIVTGNNRRKESIVFYKIF